MAVELGAPVTEPMAWLRGRVRACRQAADRVRSRWLPGAGRAADQGELRACPALLRIQPASQILRLPLAVGPDMRVQETVRIAEDLDIHAPERRVRAPARKLDSLYYALSR